MGSGLAPGAAVVVTSSEPDRLHTVLVVVAFWLLGAIFALLWFPIWPRTALGWLVLLLAGPLAMLVLGAIWSAGAAIYDVVFPRIDRLAASRTLRVVLKIAVVGMILAILWWLWLQASTHLPPGLKTWWMHNFA